MFESYDGNIFFNYCKETLRPSSIAAKPSNTMRFISFFLSFSFIVSLLVITITVNAQEDSPTLRAVQYNLEKGLAIQGYDPVVYITERKAMKGDPKISLNYAGITYYFSSRQHLDLFKKSPSAYEPQYGGWCAYAMGAKGEKVEVDPETFKIIQGKLYLYYNAYFNNTLKSWNKNEAALKAKADANWKRILNQNNK